ncbi:uncharacterized protein LOC124930276 [Impatiens glandulifera]|uniref:uncharacterized protein LOC124930276 n=1 Tax=Impatiens glandulifera TaxID=253017 RepID=UPI001FB1574C|nr:uncharacterized protein LOC124930276 [Impatiens glandulifera]
MTPNFAYVVCSIEESKDLSRVSIDELQSNLLVHEQQMTAHVDEEQALKVTYGESSRGQRHGSFRGRGRSSERHNYEKSSIGCFGCHKLWHFQYECLGKSQERAHYVETEEEMLLMSYIDEGKKNQDEICMGFLDSGYSNHVSGKKKLFTTFVESFREIVKLGNNSRVKVMGKRTVVMIVNGITQVITSVFYVPNLTNNLLSIRQLADKGLEIVIK